MKKCPSCNRAYSDTVTQCPTCGIELSKNAASSTGNGSKSQGNGNVQTHDQKVVNSGTKKKKNNAGRWKAASAVFLTLAIVFAVLYATQVSEYDTLERKYSRKNREYNSLSEDYDSLRKEKDSLSKENDVLKQEYEALKDVIALYDLRGKYTIDVTDIYNGTEEYKRISSELSRQKMNSLCFHWNVYDYTESWDDVLYVDVLTPDGKVFKPDAASNNHTWKIDMSDTVGDRHGRKAWFHEGTWQSGIYRIIFYQGSRAIDSFEVKVA